MREFIKTTEFTGKLKVEDKFEFEQVRCIYEDDYYSNKLMKGDFEVGDLSADFLNKFKPGLNFIFVDNSGREIKGTLNGFSLKTEFNEKKNILHFNADDYIQWLSMSENKSNKVKIRYSLPYISAFSRFIKFSYGFDENYIFKFISPNYKLTLDLDDIVFDDYVYLLKYKEPDSIFKRELFIEIEKKIDNYETRIDSLNQLENKIDEMLIVISFILNHRVSSYGYKADFFGDDDKLTEILELKDSKKNIGAEFLINKRKSEFDSYFIEENLNNVINSFFLKNKDDNGQIKGLLYSFITVSEIKVFQPMFLAAYFVLEGISKLIVKPEKNTESETLIKDAINKIGIDFNKVDFKLSRNRLRKSNSKLEWEISEYRDNLTHFNNISFDGKEMWVEYKKIMRLNRKLILSYIEPSLSDWSYPTGMFDEN